MSQTKAELLGNIRDNMQINAQYDLRFADADSSHYIAFQSPATVSSSIIFTLPATDGSANYLLKTDGSGNLGWAADSTTDSTKMPLAGGTFTGDVIFTGDAANVVWDKSADDLIFYDNAQAVFGTSSDFKILHDGTDSYLDHSLGSGLLRINAAAGSEIRLTKSGPETLAKFIPDGAVELFYDNSKKFETTSEGAIISGTEGQPATLAIYADEGDDNADKWRLRSETSGNFNIQNYASGGWETAITGVGNGTVELRYDNSKKFETQANGVTVTGGVYSDGLICGDNDKIELGDSGDLWFEHNGAWATIDNNTGDLNISTTGSGDDIFINSADDISLRVAGTEDGIKVIGDGAVELYHNNVKKLSTDSAGIVLTDMMYILDSKKAVFGDGSDLQIYHTGSQSYVQNTSANALWIQNASGQDVTISNTSAGEKSAKFNIGGAATLYYDNIEKLATNSGGVEISGHCYFPDNNGSYYGAGEDLKIYHNGSTQGYIINGSGNLNIRTGGALWIDNTDGSETYIKATEGGAVELYYNNGKKFETTSNGIAIAGIYTQVANVSNNWAFDLHHDGDEVGRYGMNIKCGDDAAAGTNYAIGIGDGDGTTQGQVTFSGGTVTYGTFTAYHPCIVPNSDNPSDQALAYPYGTLLETISIEYTQKNGANTERGIRYQVQKTQSANSKKVLGAYGGSMNGGPDNHTNQHQALILGDGHILVNNAGGNIEIGDGICSSSTAGIGQKATVNPSMIIGIAQEAITFTGSETKLVAVQYGLQQFIPWT